MLNISEKVVKFKLRWIFCVSQNSQQLVCNRFKDKSSQPELKPVNQLGCHDVLIPFHDNTVQNLYINTFRLIFNVQFSKFCPFSLQTFKLIINVKILHACI